MSKYAVKIGIIGGSGLDDPNILEGRKEEAYETPYGPPSDVLISGKIRGVDCVLLARHGRKHTIMPSNVNYRANIWALRAAGCTHVIASTATGSLQEDIPPGCLVVLDSFVDRTRVRSQTFYDGEEGSPAGVCHLPMEPAFCPDTRQVVVECARELGLDFRPTGTCVVIEGPRFSSLAESRVFRAWGGHVINMTTVPEVVLAKEAGLCYCAVAMATDYDCWKERDVVTVNDVLTTFRKNVSKVISLFTLVVPRIAARNWDATIDSLKETVRTSVMLPHK
ncbi:S-methyl-5'-thioadenosine phosphorylase [Bacillus rossius redtenbacheri]|uniref:S-methyl-5'-thioadenosine phosphorylase n=1 Tax=Bacillus rossius redtenbacheri TaxID=93214 RepID=UPI002FDD6017